MHYAMRTINDPDSAVSGARIEYEREPCIAVTRGMIVEIYNLDLRPVDVIYPNGYVTLIVPVVFRSSKRFLLVSNRGDYAIMGRDKPVVCGRMPAPLSYIKCIRTSKNFIFIAENDTVTVASMGHEGLVFGDDVNDFGYYKILDGFSNKGDVGFLLEDISGDVFYSRYQMAPSKPKMILKEKMLLRKGLVSARAIGDGLLLIGEGKLYYYVRGKFVLESEFANPGIKNTLAADGSILLSMEDGEIIRISLEGNIPTSNKTCENEIASYKGLSLKTEVLGNLGSWFSVLLHLEDKLYYGGSPCGNSYHLEIGKELRVLKTFEGGACPMSLSYLGTSFRYISRNSIKKITYSVDLSVEPRYNLSGVIRRFGIADGVLIVSHPNQGKVLREGMSEEQDFGEILNIHIDGYCYFNTKNHMYRLKGRDISSLEIKDIVLSSYHQGLCIVFTGDRNLKAICLETMECIECVECPYEVSLLYLHSYLFISTYYDEFIIMNKHLQVVHRRKHEILKSVCIAGGRLFFGDMHGVGYEVTFGQEPETSSRSILSILKETEEENKWELLFLKPSFFSDTMIETMIPVGRHIMGIGVSSIFIDLQDFSCYKCSLEGISYALVADHLYVSVGKSIYRCHLGSIPKIKISIEDKLQETDPRNGYVLKFSAMNDEKEVTGLVSPILNIDNDPIINSYLSLKVKRHVHNLFLQDEIVMDGRFLSRHYFVVVSNLSREGSFSRLAMFSTRGNCIKLVYESTGEGVVHALDSDGDYLATHRNHNVYVYKRQARILVELCVMKIGFIPYRIAMHGSKIACSCIYRSFGVFTFNEETNHLSLDFLSNGKEQIESMVFALESLILTTTDGKVLMLDRNYNMETLSIGDRITSMCPGSLSLPRSDSVYFTTRNGGIGILGSLTLGNEELGLLTELERHAGRLAPFFQEKTTRIINVDVINNMNSADLEDFIEAGKYDRNKIIMALDRLNTFY
ncbi:uncharacterized protein Eint_051190 [Encephalitozoon intestinalis ATCC 50506]|uniref:RSE1/DDB1/CPSF1 C-terminal domain-containing protein n=1 Tax=Encephalitozoon intestinalis (strain ATCC 50506) TaxID=876142 RepID=E0S6Y0_ENCIT|nr:uncharacterized protein Eint_051190 [Encephalitozoon intestinalis ATCC 50506]ADM11566.1 hypothetical protein Eint_051190 [Encephalitozoon intestinalis ATCC 50506]UTX45281.1 DNA damage-binding protein [Encephalitozoon intestinalis]